MTIFGGGDAVALGTTDVPATDQWSVVGKDLVQWQDQVIDLASRRQVSQPKGCCGIAISELEQTEQSVFAERADGGKLRVVKAGGSGRSFDVPNGPPMPRAAH